MTQITGLTISGSEITINYNANANAKQGLLSETAFSAANQNLKASGNGAFRSVGYFGIGFGGNTKSNGKKSQLYALNDMDLTRYTHINASFLAINSKGNLTIPNSFSSQGSTSTQTTPPWLSKVNKAYRATKVGKSDPDYKKVEYVNAIFEDINKQRIISNNKSIRIMPCIGGWNVANNTGNGTEKYGDILHTLAKGIENNQKNLDQFIMYKNFKKDLSHLINKGWAYGVDIDWEYPGRPPIASQCTDNKGTSRACKVNEPTQIGPCNKGHKACASFSYNDKALVYDRSDSHCKNATYRLPISEPDKDNITKSYKKPTYYSAFIKAIKDDIKAKEVSIALAGAPWGLHWYANTAATLLKSNHIDFANVMAYDYNGFWGNGVVSGFLSNMTNMNTLKSCKYIPPPQDCISKACYNCLKGTDPSNNFCNTQYGYVCIYPTNNSSKVRCGSQNQPDIQICGSRNLPICKNIPLPSAWDSCIKSTYIKFNNNKINNNLSVDKASDTCPLIYYNLLVDAKGNTPGDLTQSQINSLWKTLNSSGYWYNDFNKVESITSLVHDSPGYAGPYITLSTLTMLNILTSVFGINKNQLVIGLPYYGRTFQAKSSGSRSFKQGSYGLYQPYSYGSSYSYSDIYETYYKAGGKKDVYTILLDEKNNYTEDIVYTKSLLTHITDEMNEEMISYNSAASIKAKVKYAKDKGFGGYMCWHMLSDYYPDA